MRKVENFLVVGVRMDSGHKGAFDHQVIVNDLGSRGKAVRRARGVGNHMMGLGIILVLVHTQDDGQIFTLRRGSDDDLLGATLSDMVFSTFDLLAFFVHAIRFQREDTGAFNHDIHTDITPRNVGRVGLFERLYFLAVDHEAIICNFDSSIEPSIV